MNDHTRNVIKTLWLTRPDLRDASGNDPEKFEDLMALRIDSEYAGLEGLVTESKIKQWDAIKEEFEPQGEWPRLNGLMHAIWASRPDLQDVFDINTSSGRQGLSSWFIFNGFSEMKLAPLLGERLRAELNAPVDIDGQPATDKGAGRGPFTRLMYEVWMAREDLQRHFPLVEERGYEGFQAWFFAVGLEELRLETVIDKSGAEWLSRPVESGMPRSDSAEHASLEDKAPPARILSWMAKHSPIGKQGDKAEKERRKKRKPRVFEWWLQYHEEHREWAESLDYDQALAWLLSGEGREASPVFSRVGQLLGADGATPEEAGEATAVQDKPYGMNLIGYAKGQFGIGEDVRMAARCCQAAGIPFIVYNVAPGIEVEQGDNTVVEYLSSDLPYSINLFCTTGIETALMLARSGRELFDGHYNIGYWPWELPAWPEAWHHAYELVDEVWASSRYAYHTFKRSAPVPVRHMPMAVTVDQSEGLARSDFGLSETDFLFVYGFDFLSYPSRKNPFAAIEAFKRAFPLGSEPAGLVIKVMRAQERPAEWQALQQAMAGDARIHAIADTLSRGALLDLYRACDAFISLHRSEGFGRNIAEAMSLEKPVIVTGYSGNMDFTTPATAALVEHEMVTLQEGEYPFGEGLEWADPSVDHAAALMARLLKDPHHARRLARNGRQSITSMCHPEVVGEEYRYTLQQHVVPRLEQARFCRQGPAGSKQHNQLHHNAQA
ncbi:MAG: glycosyltransferase [Pseudomonadota bacterium]